MTAVPQRSGQAIGRQTGPAVPHRNAIGKAILLGAALAWTRLLLK